MLTDITDTFFTGDSAEFKEQLAQFVAQFGMTSEDVKNLTWSALLGKMTAQADNSKTRAILEKATEAAAQFGLSDKLASSILK